MYLMQLTLGSSYSSSGEPCRFASTVREVYVPYPVPGHRKEPLMFLPENDDPGLGCQPETI
jgi:hypothetical protein